MLRSAVTKVFRPGQCSAGVRAALVRRAATDPRAITAAVVIIGHRPPPNTTATDRRATAAAVAAAAAHCAAFSAASGLSTLRATWLACDSGSVTTIPSPHAVPTASVAGDLPSHSTAQSPWSMNARHTILSNGAYRTVRHSSSQTASDHHHHQPHQPHPPDPHAAAPVSEFYSRQIASGRLQDDAAQRRLCTALDAIVAQLRIYQQRSSSWIPSFLKAKPAPPRGLYIYGGVGSGKTMLMDVFYDALLQTDKKRTHFHRFMQDVHSRIHKQKMMGVGDPIPPVAAELAAEAGVLCFDEFQVTDVADAVILRRLFQELFTAGVVMVATSNRAPEDLYKGGLQRPLFLPFIPLLKAHCDIFPMASEKDYRMHGILTRLQRQSYFAPLTLDNQAGLRSFWNELVEEVGCTVAPRDLEAKGRKVHVPISCGKMAFFTFEQLCIEPRGPVDYIRIMEEFDLVFLANIPYLTLNQRDWARRLITFVDCVYDREARLVCSAEALPNRLLIKDINAALTDAERTLLDDLQLNGMEASNLFTGEDERFAWDRFVSRMFEMQSKEYWLRATKKAAQREKAASLNDAPAAKTTTTSGG